jgi:hypothetical protein
MPSRRVEKLRTRRIDLVKITDSILKPDLLLYSVERVRTAIRVKRRVCGLKLLRDEEQVPFILFQPVLQNNDLEAASSLQIHIC